MPTLGELLRSKLDRIEKENTMLRDALVLGFVNDSGNFILYKMEELVKMRKLIEKQNTIELIKEVRRQHGIGLAEAKDFVDAVRACIPYKEEELNMQEIVGKFYYRDDR